MRNPIEWIKALFTSTEQRDAAEAERADAEHVARLANDPFRFRDRESWMRFRRQHGYSTRRLR